MPKIGLTCFAVLVAGIVAFVSLGDRTLDDHEAFVSVTAREMIANNEYIIPTFNGRYRLNKTPLPYWLVVAAEHLTGRIDEFTARLPTAVMSVLSVIVILYFVSLLLDFRTAFLASLVWTCSLAYIRYSHSARPEMALTLFMLVSFLSFYAAIEEPNRKRQIVYAFVFWVSLGLSVLAKAPPSVFFMTFAAIIYLAVFNRWRRVSAILPVWGILLFLMIVLPWPLAAAHAMHWDLTLWKDESVGRFTGDTSGGGHSSLYYLARMFMFMLPWSAFVPYAVAAPFFKVWQEKRRFTGYLWIALFSGILFLTLCTGKRQHYILPLMPLTAILVATVMEDMVFGGRVFTKSERLDVLGWHMAVFFLGGIAAAAMAYEPIYEGACRLAGRAATAFSEVNATMPAYSAMVSRYALAIGLVLIVGGALATYLYVRQRAAGACVAIFGAVALVVVWAYASVGAMQLDENRAVAQLALRVKKMIPPGEGLFAYGEPSGVFVQYFGRPLEALGEADLDAAYDDGRWILAYSDDLKVLNRKHDLKQVAVGECRSGDKRDRPAVFHKTG